MLGPNILTVGESALDREIAVARVVSCCKEKNASFFFSQELHPSLEFYFSVLKFFIEEIL